MLFFKKFFGTSYNTRSIFIASHSCTVSQKLNRAESPKEVSIK